MHVISLIVEVYKCNDSDLRMLGWVKAREAAEHLGRSRLVQIQAFSFLLVCVKGTLLCVQKTKLSFYCTFIIQVFFSHAHRQGHVVPCTAQTQK